MANASHEAAVAVARALQPILPKNFRGEISLKVLDAGTVKSDAIRIVSYPRER